MKERLNIIVKALRINTADLATRLQVSKSSIAHMLNGRNKPSIDFIEKLITNFPEIDLEWLITGKGNWKKKSLSGATASPTLFDDDNNKTNDAGNPVKDNDASLLEAKNSDEPTHAQHAVREPNLKMDDEPQAAYGKKANKALQDDKDSKTEGKWQTHTVKGIIIELSDGSFRYLQPEKK